MFNIQAQSEMAIGGKVRPVAFNWNQIGEFTAMHGGPLHVFDAFITKWQAGTFNYLEYRDFVFTCLKWGAKRTKAPVDFTNEDVGDWIGECSDDARAGFVVFIVTHLATSVAGTEKKSPEPLPLPPA